METPGLGAQLVGDVVHVHLWVGHAAAAVGFGRVVGRGSEWTGHEGDEVWGPLIGGEENGVESEHLVHGVSKKANRNYVQEKGGAGEAS